ncbi:MAG: PqqD family protein [Solirubrobacteraceae bacterium]
MTERLRLRATDIHWREIDAEMIILDARAQRYLALNRTGVGLWHLLVDGATRDELIAELRSAYGIDAEQAAGDVDALLRELSSRSLLAARPPAATSGPSPDRSRRSQSGSSRPSARRRSRDP